MDEILRKRLIITKLLSGDRYRPGQNTRTRVFDVVYRKAIIKNKKDNLCRPISSQQHNVLKIQAYLNQQLDKECLAYSNNDHEYSSFDEEQLNDNCWVLYRLEK